MRQVTPEQVERDHVSDLEAQESHGVTYLKYWFDQARGMVCCLVDGPNAEACAAVHRAAHGNVADEVIPVEAGLLEAFLGHGRTSTVGSVLNRDGKLQSAFRTVVFTDMVGSTATTQAGGDAAMMHLLRIHDRIVRDALGQSGREVKHTGDGIMAAFVSASEAIAFAQTVQQTLAAHNDADPDHPVLVRIGMSAGEPIDENRDLFGTTVQLAARLCDQGAAGEILVAGVVRDLCLGKGLTFQDRGATSLRGFGEPVRFFAVGWT